MKKLQSKTANDKHADLHIDIQLNFSKFQWNRVVSKTDFRILFFPNSHNSICSMGAIEISLKCGSFTNFNSKVLYSRSENHSCYSSTAMFSLKVWHTPCFCSFNIIFEWAKCSPDRVFVKILALFKDIVINMDMARERWFV